MICQPGHPEDSFTWIFLKDIFVVGSKIFIKGVGSRISSFISVTVGWEVREIKRLYYKPVCLVEKRK